MRHRCGGSDRTTKCGTRRNPGFPLHWVVPMNFRQRTRRKGMKRGVGGFMSVKIGSCSGVISSVLWIIICRRSAV